MTDTARIWLRPTRRHLVVVEAQDQLDKLELRRLQYRLSRHRRLSYAESRTFRRGLVAGLTVGFALGCLVAMAAP